MAETRKRKAEEAAAVDGGAGPAPARASAACSAPVVLREAAVAGFGAVLGGGAVGGARPTALGVAPGRAEVLGNHTDYNEGFILAAAIDKYVVVAGAASGSAECRVASDAFPGVVVDFRTDVKEGEWLQQKQSGDKAWANYVIGVVSELCKRGVAVGGFDAFLASNVPPGAGVSSSAAVEMATAKLAARLFPDSVGKLSTLELVKVAKAAENNFVGMGCGILDQFSSGRGRAGALLFLDCRSLDHSHVPFAGANFVLANTHAPHQLVDGKYDELRRDCFAAVEALKKSVGAERITHLRDVDSATLEEHSGSLPETQQRRSRHIVTENERVQRGIEALRRGDMAAMGECMSKSHASSRDLFGNSCRELDLMQRLANGIEGCLGTRLMGGGFGGSTISLVREEATQAFVAELSRRYEAEAGLTPTVLVCRPGDGAFHEDV